MVVGTLAPRRAAMCLASLLTAATSLSAQDDDVWHQFTSSPHSAQEHALEQLRASLPQHALLAALRGLAESTSQPPPPRGEVQGQKRPKKAREFPDQGLRLPCRVDYLFGTGAIAPRPDVLLPEHAPKAAARHRAAAKHATAFDPTPVHHALLGAVPDADLALAALMMQLDRDASGDEFATFLQIWRNGDESFYEALDRTAGTADSVFFFDVMLDDFRGRFGRGKGEAKLPGGLQAAHDALHQAFLAYRQYRGFREAVAWSLVLPVDAPLPARLARYEADVPGGYSLRQQVLMAAAALDHDLVALCDKIAASAPPLPQPVWSGDHDPYPAWTALFTSLQPRMIARARSTDTFLENALTERRDLSKALVERATRLCAEAAAAH
ncbi:MAG: hypothetical protein H6835_02770 [Planctomycetes bacterium]|nr:hypothetical protein [Planctomycetota bacterium]